MQVGSLVETVADFTEEQAIYNLPYPQKGDYLVISEIRDHHNPQCKSLGIVLLSFEELPTTPGLCDKQIDGTPNFVELLPPIPDDYEEPEPMKRKITKPELQTV